MVFMTRCLLLLLPVVLAACNTVAGMGQDLAAAGQALSHSVGKVTGSQPAQAAAPPPAVQGSSAPPRSLTPAQPEEPK